MFVSERAKDLASVCEVRGIKIEKLSRNAAIEDFIIASRKLLPRATAMYAVKLRKDRTGEEVKVDDFQTKLEDAVERSGDLSKVPGGIITVLAEEAAKLVGVKTKLSKVGIAREYVNLLESGSIKFDKRDFDKAVKLGERIQALLEIPKRTTTKKIIEDDD